MHQATKKSMTLNQTKRMNTIATTKDGPDEVNLVESVKHKNRVEAFLKLEMALCKEKLRDERNLKLIEEHQEKINKQKKGDFFSTNAE